MTGILGGLAIILAFIGLGALPLNVGGLLLIIFGLVLIGLELTVTSHGLLGFGGVVCIVLGASALYTEPGDPFEPVFRVAPAVIVTIAIIGGTFIALIAWAAVRSRRHDRPDRARGTGRRVRRPRRRPDARSSRSARPTSRARNGRRDRLTTGRSIAAPPSRSSRSMG